MKLLPTNGKIKLLYQSSEIINLLRDAKVPVGGAAVEWNTWLNAFSDIGCNVGLLVPKQNYSDLTTELKFELIQGLDLEKGLPILKPFINHLPQLYKAIKKYNPDFILQGCATRFTGYLAYISKLLGKPFIHRIGSDMDADGRIKKTLSPVYQVIYYWGIRNANHISCQNKYQYDILKKKYPQKSISILHNPYFFKNREIKKRGNRNYVAWVGNFRFEKNLPALAYVAEKFPDTKFKIAGTRFHTTDNDTEKGLGMLDKMKNVKFLGHIDNSEIPDFLSNAILLLNTSRLEGFSNTFLEAWAVGTPVISTNNVNPDRIISDHNIGLIAETYDELPDKINKLLLYSNEQFGILSKNCVEYVKEKHDPIKLAKLFLDEILRTRKN